MSEKYEMNTEAINPENKFKLLRLFYFFIFKYRTAIQIKHYFCCSKFSSKQLEALVELYTLY